MCPADEKENFARLKHTKEKSFAKGIGIRRRNRISMKRLIVLADTHVGQRIDRIPEVVARAIESSSIVVHAGDYTNIETVETLKAYGKVFYGVRGNMDDNKIRIDLPESLVFELNGVRFGLVHGDGSPWGLARRVYDRFSDPKPDVLIFGHSHIPLEEKYDDTLVLNPGSVSGNLFSRCGSYIFMELDEKGGLKYEIVEIIP